MNIQLLKEKADKEAADIKRRKEMAEAEKLKPVTLIRSQQGHRFIKKVPQAEEHMLHELEQQKKIIERNRKTLQQE